MSDTTDDTAHDLVCSRDDCDTTENVRRFHFFDDSREPELLCWEHREPFIRERLDESNTSGDESEHCGQSGLTDF